MSDDRRISIKRDHLRIRIAGVLAQRIEHVDLETLSAPERTVYLDDADAVLAAIREYEAEA